jgi:hypothetical protein
VAETKINANVLVVKSRKRLKAAGTFFQQDRNQVSRRNLVSAQERRFFNLGFDKHATR